MGPPSQAQRLAALPDMVELGAWMLHLQAVVHSAPEAYAQARGLAVEAVMRQDEFRQLEHLRQCNTITVVLKMVANPHCAPDELLGGEGAGELGAARSAGSYAAGRPWPAAPPSHAGWAGTASTYCTRLHK